MSPCIAVKLKVSLRLVGVGASPSEAAPPASVATSELAHDFFGRMVTWVSPPRLWPGRQRVVRGKNLEPGADFKKRRTAPVLDSTHYRIAILADVFPLTCSSYGKDFESFQKAQVSIGCSNARRLSSHSTDLKLMIHRRQRQHLVHFQLILIHAFIVRPHPRDEFLDMFERANQGIWGFVDAEVASSWK